MRSKSAPTARTATDAPATARTAVPPKVAAMPATVAQTPRWSTNCTLSTSARSTAATLAGPYAWSVTHVANVAWPTPGLCFRMVYSQSNSYPSRCPEPPCRRGVFVNPPWERLPVEACEEHSVGH